MGGVSKFRPPKLGCGKLQCSAARQYCTFPGLEGEEPASCQGASAASSPCPLAKICREETSQRYIFPPEYQDIADFIILFSLGICIRIFYCILIGI